MVKMWFGEGKGGFVNGGFMDERGLINGFLVDNGEEKGC